jgi:hemolysin activation/secretion protein
LAQQIPGAGQQVQQVPPPLDPIRRTPDLHVNKSAIIGATAAATGARIKVSRVHIEGETLFSAKDLLGATSFKTGSLLTLSDLRNIASQITHFYNSRGYFLAQAYLPAQDIAGETVTVSVIEGHYGTLAIDNESSLSAGVPRAMMASLGTGATIASAPLERRLLLLSDIPGITVQSTLSPGEAPGTSDLRVNLKSSRLISGGVEADNAGNRFTGAYRAGGTLIINNPTGRGDLLSLRALVSNSGFAYARGSYETLFGISTAGLAYSHISYALGHEFSPLGAEGTADVAGVFGSYPLVRSRRTNLNALAGADIKFFKDRLKAADTENRRSAKVFNLGLNGNHQDAILGGGYTAFSVGATVGDLSIRSPLDREVDAATAHTDGGYAKLQAGVSRLQSLTDSLSLYVALRGQLASKNLDSAEKMELGGAYAVRAYPEGEAYGDEGYVATAEARYLLPESLPIPGRLQLFGFVDTGAVKYAKNPWFPGANTAHRSGIGAGVAWAAPQGILLKATYARKLGNETVTSQRDRVGRFWFQMTKLF